MKQNFNPKRNYAETKKAIGYVTRKKATQKDYDSIGFMSGLEVHQQLQTREKLFCHCPAGLFQKPNQYDAELIRHMRPTLSELGEYDGTALMEFRTRKQIVYLIKNETACTYDVDDTPPFRVNREALDFAIEIALLSKLKIVGEVHISRKQYLDGSIPTGFQRTAIIGVEGEIQLKKKKVRLIQLSLEEDSCREVSDIGHVRIYRTDRLGMPLIETVTYPELSNPDEVRECADYIRFLNRSSGKARTGIGSTRADVNVSCKGGTRVEIKGVAHTRWMPELTHNEAYRQWALLKIRDILKKKIANPKDWKMTSMEIHKDEFIVDSMTLPEGEGENYKIYALNLPGFQGIMSHFTQPGKMFADDFSERLKVVACIEQPNMIHSEMFEDIAGKKTWKKVQRILDSQEGDAQIVFWGPEADVKTAIETIDERCKMAFTGVPNETRKSFEDGSTIFERVLPGADRMYPDTDSAPIPLEDSLITTLTAGLPPLVSDRIAQLAKWQVPEDAFTYLLKNNLIPLIERIQDELNVPPRFSSLLFAHTLKHLQGQYRQPPDFTFEKIFELLRFLHSRNIDLAIAKKMMFHLYQHPKMDFESILITLGFKEVPKEDIVAKIPFLVKKFKETRISPKDEAGVRWIMGNINKVALGNASLSELSKLIKFQ